MYERFFGVFGGDIGVLLFAGVDRRIEMRDPFRSVGLAFSFSTA
jgi:hypothetical protein